MSEDLFDELLDRWMDPEDDEGFANALTRFRESEKTRDGVYLVMARELARERISSPPDVNPYLLSKIRSQLDENGSELRTRISGTVQWALYTFLTFFGVSAGVFLGSNVTAATQEDADLESEVVDQITLSEYELDQLVPLVPESSQ